MHLLLVEDDQDLGASLQRVLRREGHTSEWVRGATQGLAFAEQRPFDCALLDLGLPDGHGLDVLKRMRAAGLGVPVIIITASAGVGERIQGLDLGADDFIVKPFDMSELLSRIRAVTRRTAQQAQAVWRVGALEIDTARHEVSVHGEPVRLAPREYALLCALAATPEKVVPKHRLASQLAPVGEPLDFNAIEFHVHNLRAKLGPSRVGTVRGVGYLLRAV
jgi:DNA-binding response OmpR family regulator